MQIAYRFDVKIALVASVIRLVAFLIPAMRDPGHEIKAEEFGMSSGVAIKGKEGVPALFNHRFAAASVFAIFAVVVSAVVLNPYYLSLTTQAGVYTIVVLGLVAVLGFGGMSMLGQVAFFGLGAYLAAAGTVMWGLTPLEALLVSVAGTSVIAVVVGWPTLRLRGPYLAVATFALSLAFTSFVSASNLFHGQLGIGPVPKFSIGGLEASSWLQRHFLVWVIALLAMAAVWNINRRRFGRAVAVLAHDEELGESVGVRASTVKLALFVVAAVLGAMGGALFAFTNGYVSPESFSFTTTVTVFAILFVGGTRSVLGVGVAAVVLITVPALAFNSVQNLQPTLFSLIVLAALIIRPSTRATFRNHRVLGIPFRGIGRTPVDSAAPPETTASPPAAHTEADSAREGADAPARSDKEALA